MLRRASADVPEWLWHNAAASASDASNGLGNAVSPSSNFTMCCTWTLSALVSYRSRISPLFDGVTTSEIDTVVPERVAQ